MGSYSGAPEIHRDVRYFTDKHLDPTSMWNIINSIHSIRTYINTTISLFPTCLLIHHSFIFIGSLPPLSIWISSAVWLTRTRLAGINFTGLIMCSAILFPVAAFISAKNSFRSCPSFNLKAFERELLYEFWRYRWSFINCPSAYNPIYSSSNSSCVKLHLYIAVRQYGSFGQQFCLMKSISAFQCLTSVYEAWSLLVDVWSLVPFGTRRLTTMKVVFGTSGRLPLDYLPGCSPISVGGHMSPRHPFFLASQTLRVHFSKNISTHSHQMHSALSKIFNSSHVLIVSKKRATPVAQSRGPFHNCFWWFCPRIQNRCFLSSHPATHTFIYLLNVLKLGCPILLATCFKENSVCFKLIGAVPSALPKSDESSLS